MSKAILTGILRQDWHYEGVLITDGMDMQAIAGRYGAGNAAVRALAAGADLVMALGTIATQSETLDALTAAIAAGQISRAELEQRLARVRRLTTAYPCAAGDYVSEAADRALMASAWQRGLTAYRRYGAPLAPPKGSKVRLVIRAAAVSDGVSEAGVPAERVAAMLATLYEVETLTFGAAQELEWDALPRDGRYVILASTVRLRYGERARRSWKPDLHLALWNPFHILDIQAPALVSYGFAEPAIAAVRAWLAGEIAAAGHVPVAGVADRWD